MVLERRVKLFVLSVVLVEHVLPRHPPVPFNEVVVYKHGTVGNERYFVDLERLVLP